MLPAPAAAAVAVVVLSAHAALAGWDLDVLRSCWTNFLKRLGAGSKSDVHLYEQRLEEAMRKMMMEQYESATRHLAHFIAIVLLWFVYRLQQQQDMAAVVQFLVVLLNYAMSWWVVRCKLTFGKLRLLTLVSHILQCFFVAQTHMSEAAEFNFLSVFSAAIRVCVAAVIHDPPVIIPCQTFVCVVEVACYFGMEATRSGPPWPFLCGQAVILALVCGVAMMVQEMARTCIKASFKSADTTLSLEGFQRVLRSMCDAEVLLDGNFMIQGDSSRLRRVLATSTDLHGVKFTDLLDQAEKAKFVSFIQKSSKGPAQDQKTSQQSVPHCLRVYLPSAYSQVGVDIFHVPVPRLLDVEGPYHLLAITEDPESRQQPDASLGAIPEGLCMLSEEVVSASVAAASEAGLSKGSLSSSICRVQPVTELRELTMLVDASTDTQDVLQVHAKFKRDKTLPNDFHSCMPCLQTLLRPSDWLSIRMHVAKFAHEQHLASSSDSEELPPVMIRRLDDQHKYVAANTVNLAPCRGQESSKKSPLVWVYVRDFVNDDAKSRLQPEHLVSTRVGASNRG